MSSFGQPVSVDDSATAPSDGSWPADSAESQLRLEPAGSTRSARALDTAQIAPTDQAVPGALTPGAAQGTDDRLGTSVIEVPEAVRLRSTLPAGSPRVSVVIPAKNEAANLPWVLDRLPVGLHEVVLVDGSSDESTAATALWHRPDVVLVRQTRCGKGNALVCGFEKCTGDIIVTLDADDSADPAEIGAFVKALDEGADFAKGSRFLSGGGSSDLTRVRRLGNKALAFVMNRIYHTSFSDLCYGYNAFWSSCVPRLRLPPVDGTEAVAGDGFEIETLLAARAAAAHLAIVEVPSFERSRRYGRSNLNTWRDGWLVLRTILRERRGAALRAQRRDAQARAARDATRRSWDRRGSPR